MFVALTALVAAHFVDSTVSTIEHGIDANHHAATWAVSYAYEHAAPDIQVDTGIEASQPDHAPTPHHHHADGPQIALLAPAEVDLTPKAGAAKLVPGPSTGSPLSLTYGPDRPPRSPNERPA